jgi:hypothetical protein
LLTPRIDYPPDPPVQRPSHDRLRQQQTDVRSQQIIQSNSPSRQRFPSPTPETPTHGSTPTHSDTPDQQQVMIQLQYNQALLEMNRLSLLPHQKDELLRLQLQLNHLQQLSLKQQIKTQQLQEEASHLSPGSPLVKSTTRSALCAPLSPRPSFSMYFNSHSPSESHPCSLGLGLSHHLALLLQSLALPIRFHRTVPMPLITDKMLLPPKRVSLLWENWKT